MPSVYEEIASDRRAERIASLRQRIADMRQKIAEYQVAKRAQRMTPEEGLSDFGNLVQPASDSDTKAQVGPASANNDLTGMTLPAHGPIDFQKLSQPSSQLAATVPSGPLAASSTAVAPVVPPTPETISTGPGIDYGRETKIGAVPESWTKQPQEALTSVGAVARNLGREAISLGNAIAGQVVHLARLSNPTANPDAYKSVVEDVTGMVSASIDAINNAGTAIGINPFEGGLNPIVEHAKVWLDSRLSQEDERREHAAIDAKYPAYAKARDTVNQNLLGTALGIVGIVAPLKGAIALKPMDLVKQARIPERPFGTAMEQALAPGKRIEAGLARGSERITETWQKDRAVTADQVTQQNTLDRSIADVNRDLAQNAWDEYQKDRQRLGEKIATDRIMEDLSVSLGKEAIAPLRAQYQIDLQKIGRESAVAKFFDRLATGEARAPRNRLFVPQNVKGGGYRATPSDKGVYRAGELGSRAAKGTGVVEGVLKGEPTASPVVKTGTPITAVKLDDGTIVSDRASVSHADLVLRQGIPTERVVDGGFIVNGEYTSLTTSPARNPKAFAQEVSRVRGVLASRRSVPAPPTASPADVAREPLQPADHIADVGKMVEPAPKPPGAGIGKQPWEMKLDDYRRENAYSVIETTSGDRGPRIEITDNTRGTVDEVGQLPGVFVFEETVGKTKRMVAEFDRRYTIPDAFETLDEVVKRTEGRDWFDHRDAVEGAARQGKIGAGIADYPDLAAKYGKAAPEPFSQSTLGRSRDVTIDRLEEVRRTTGFGERKPGWTKKLPDSPLTTTEQNVIKKVGDGVDIGFVSNSLVYSDFVHYLPKIERKALWSLIDRGKLGVERIDKGTQGNVERIIPKVSETIADTPAPVSLTPEVKGTTETVTPTQEMGGGLGAPGVSTSLGAKLGLEMRRQKTGDAAVSVEVQREARKPGVAQFFRRPIAFVGQFGQHAKAAMERIVLASRDAQVEVWRRDNFMNEIQREIPRQDWGKRGEKFWESFEGRKIEDIMADPNLQPGTKSAATKLRKFLDDDRTAQLDRIRERNRGWVTADVEKAYRKEIATKRGDPLGVEGDPSRAEIARRVDVRLKEMVPESWRIEDYLPHVFPGEYFVKIKNADGGWTTVGSAGTRMEAMSKVAEVAHQMNITDAAQFQVVNKGFNAPDVVRLGAGRYWSMFKELKESMKISDADIHAALAGKIGTRTGRQKWAGPLQHRTGTEGFIKDLPRAMEFYNRAISRNVSSTKMAREVTPMIEGIRRNNPQLADYLQSNFDAVWGMKRSTLSEAFDASLQNTPGLRDFVSPFALERWTAAVVKQPIVYLKWKLSPRAQALNSLQLAQTGIKLSTGELAEGIRFAHTEAGHAAMKNHGVEAFAGGRFTEFGKLRATHLAGTETFNQRSIWSAFYRKGLKAGMDDVAANDYAYLKGNLESQFAYNPADVPPVMRGPIGSTILMFKRFTVNDLELGASLLKEKNFPGAAKWLGAKLLIGGLKGVTSPLTWVAGGYLTHKMYQKVSEEYGKEVADAISYGLPGLIGLDMSYSMQMIDAPRESALGNLGPVGGDVERYARALIGNNAVEPSTGKRVLNTALQSNPGVGRMIDGLSKLFQGANEGMYDFKTPDGKLKFRGDLKELVIYGLGGKTIADKVLVGGKPIGEPLDIWLDALADANAKRDAALDEIAAKRINDEQYDFLADKDRFNGLYPEFPITNGDISIRVKARRKSLTQNRAERILQTAPKAVKRALTPAGGR